MKKLAVVIPLIAALFLACVATGPGGKTSLVIIPTGQEVAIGAGMAQEVEATEKILNDPVWQSYLNEVGQKIVSVCDRKDIDYHFTVIESDQVNAFAAPGGYVYFYTGLLKEMHSEAELAAVVAHEVSHVVARHSMKRIQAAMGVAMAYELVFGDSSSQVLQTAVGVGLGLLSATYSRSNEREADSYGITYMVRAGYHPDGAMGMFETLAALGGAGSTSVFEQLASTHPETQERINNARAQMAEMQPLSSSLTIGRERYEQMLKRLPVGSTGSGGR
ncbi:MAG: M48 family metalloprotease [candidate division Zixibacteria bacterium]|nr:M48 family metalloprotease [candidate division Zixibacteria bacterium]